MAGFGRSEASWSVQLKPLGAGTVRTISLAPFCGVKTTNVSQSNFEPSLEVRK